MNQPSPPQKNAFKPVWGLVAVLTGLCAIMLVRAIVEQDIIPWRHDFAAAGREALRSGKPRLLYFTSDYCEPCEEMSHTTWADRRVAAALSGYVPVKIDFLKELELDRRFGVEAIPALIIIDPQGHIRSVSVGGIDTEEFLQWLSGPASVRV